MRGGVDRGSGEEEEMRRTTREGVGGGEVEKMRREED